MKLKSYFANSVQDAIEKARLELGPDAMLIRSSETTPDLKDLGRYEVVFGVAPAGTALPGAKPPAESVAGIEGNTVMQELAELRKQLELVAQSLTRSNAVRETERWKPELSGICDRLTAAGFSSGFAHDLTQAVALRTQPQAERPHRMVSDQRDLFARDLLHAITEEEIASRFEVEPTLGNPQHSSSAVMFVGAPGAGKSSSLMKLGLQHGLKARRPLHLLSLDTLRIGGFHHLSTYARISGAEFRALEHSSLLENAIAALPQNALALIDTPGFGTADSAEADLLANFVQRLQVEVQLVLPCYVSLTAADQIFRRFARFQPAKLLLTHSDSFEQGAPLIELAARARLPISFLGIGQQVPEDIEAADKAKLIRNLVPRGLSTSVAA